MKNNILFGLILSFTISLGFLGHSQGSTNLISPKEFEKSIHSEKNPQIVDVRTPQEFSSGHVSGAQNINWNDSDFKILISKLDTTKTVYVYCQVGGRSAPAHKELVEAGFKVKELDGGMNAWSSEERKVVK